jgi:hypothetical protein
MDFSTTVLLGGKTATGLVVPDEVVEALGGGRRPAVRVTVNAHSYRSTIAARGGQYLLPLSAENRAAAGVQAGDRVQVDVELDDEPRVVTPPSDLSTALASDPAADRYFRGLPYSHQLAYVLWIESAKKADTRARRVVDAVARLAEGRTR